jgi:hypothetical protein
LNDRGELAEGMRKISLVENSRHREKGGGLPCYRKMCLEAREVVSTYVGISCNMRGGLINITNTRRES